MAAIVARSLTPDSFHPYHRPLAAGSAKSNATSTQDQLKSASHISSPQSQSQSTLQAARLGNRTILEHCEASYPVKFIDVSEPEAVTNATGGNAVQGLTAPATVYMVKHRGQTSSTKALRFLVRAREHSTLRVLSQTTAPIPAATQSPTEPGPNQHVHLSVEQGALLSWLPAPVSCNSYSKHHQIHEITLSTGASLFFVESFALSKNRPSSLPRSGSFSSIVDIYSNENADDISRRDSFCSAKGLPTPPSRIPLLREELNQLPSEPFSTTLYLYGPRCQPVFDDVVCLTSNQIFESRVVPFDGDKGLMIKVFGATQEPITQWIKSVAGLLKREVGEMPFSH